MHIALDMKQLQTLSPRQLLSMKILQMGTLELSQYMQELVQDNPVLDLVAPAVQQDEGDEIWARLQAQADFDNQNRAYITAEREDLDPLALAGTDGGLTYTLACHLCTQTDGSSAPAQVRRAACLLTTVLDKDGYFRENLDALSRDLQISLPVLRQGLELLQSLDPPGVAARDLSECLALQLLRMGYDGPPLTIVRQHLEQLAAKQYNAISKALGIPQRTVRELEALIKSLDPRPGAAFAATDHAQYLVPDLAVERDGTQLQVVHQDPYLPTININPYYCTLHQQSDDPQVREYLSQKLSQAKWSIQAVEQRKSTLLACAQVIVAKQTAFFQTHGTRVPLGLSDIADALSLQPSTISRAIRDKYLQCDWGVYPLGYFLMRESGENGLSAAQVKDMLASLIRDEDPAHPLSDAKLCQLLAQQGADISRRTVTKYRESLNISNTSGRKAHGK